MCAEYFTLKRCVYPNFIGSFYQTGGGCPSRICDLTVLVDYSANLTPLINTFKVRLFKKKDDDNDSKFVQFRKILIHLRY